MTTKLLFGVLAIIALLITGVSAVPTGGAASGISSNNFTVAVTGSDGGDTWIAWGEAPGAHPWASSFYTGDGDVVVWGAPIIGGSTVYYVACDNTGCDPNEQTLNIPAITPIPTTTFGAAFRNMSARHFAIDSIAPNLLPGYLATGVTPTILWGIMAVFLLFGFWFRTRSVRLVLILAFLMSAFLVVPIVTMGGANALGFNLPLQFQLIAQGLLAACVAGLLLSFIRK